MLSVQIRLSIGFLQIIYRQEATSAYFMFPQSWMAHPAEHVKFDGELRQACLAFPNLLFVRQLDYQNKTLYVAKLQGMFQDDDPLLSTDVQVNKAVEAYLAPEIATFTAGKKAGGTKRTRRSLVTRKARKAAFASATNFDECRAGICLHRSCSILVACHD
jgi:hypothetical protein